MVLSDPELLSPPDKKFWTDDGMFLPDKDGFPRPRFSVQEVSKFFFGKGPDWLRWRMRESEEYPKGYFVLDSKAIEPKRTVAGARYFTLADVERMAHALAQQGGIDGQQLTNIVVLVKTCAKVYGMDLR
jgi:hypothetical protein